MLRNAVCREVPNPVLQPTVQQRRFASLSDGRLMRDVGRLEEVKERLAMIDAMARCLCITTARTRITRLEGSEARFEYERRVGWHRVQRQGWQAILDRFASMLKRRHRPVITSMPEEMHR